VESAYVASDEHVARHEESFVREVLKLGSVDGDYFEDE
jgi:hypothetical protein